MVNTNAMPYTHLFIDRIFSTEIDKRVLYNLFFNIFFFSFTNIEISECSKPSVTHHLTSNKINTEKKLVVLKQVAQTFRNVYMTKNNIS